MKTALKKKIKKNGKRPKKNWKTNQSTKINLIGCDTIVNSPSDLWCCITVVFLLIIMEVTLVVAKGKLS